MPPLKIAVVADVLLLEMGGVSRSILGITRELARLDPNRVEVTVVAKRRPPETNGLRFRRSRSPRVPRLPDPLFALQRPLTLRGYDVVHYMDSRPPLDFPLGSSLNAVTQHGFAPVTLEGDISIRRRHRYVSKTLLRLARFADLTFTPSESERRELLRRVPVDPASVVAVHHGVDHDRFQPIPDARATVRDRFGIDGRFVLSVANYQRKKNPEALVEAFATLAVDHSDLLLVLVGRKKGRFALVLELIERLGIASRVRLLPHTGDAALQALYGSCSLFALPSLHESFGMPILEAMACGAPVLTSNVYCLPEVCGDAAVLVDPSSVSAIAAGMRRILEHDAEAEELRRRGIAHAATFTWRRSAERHLEAYERAVAGRG